MAICVHEFGGWASEGALKGGCVSAIFIWNRWADTFRVHYMCIFPGKKHSKGTKDAPISLPPVTR